MKLQSSFSGDSLQARRALALGAIGLLSALFFYAIDSQPGVSAMALMSLGSIVGGLAELRRWHRTLIGRLLYITSLVLVFAGLAVTVVALFQLATH